MVEHGTGRGACHGRSDILARAGNGARTQAVEVIDRVPQSKPLLDDMVVRLRAARTCIFADYFGVRLSRLILPIRSFIASQYR